MVELKPESEVTAALLLRVEAGEQDAFSQLFARHRDWLRRLVEVRRDVRLAGRVDPSDVVQDAQLETFRRLSEFLSRRPMTFRLWLRKTLEQRLQMVQRQHVEAGKRSVGREQSVGGSSAVGQGAEFAGRGPSPSQQVARHELAGRVREALLQLPEADREIVLMRTFEGLSYDEAAYVLEIDAAAARKRHGRALVRLHRLLTAGGLTESQI
ncbi:MAG TPA: sigma-70 family RNA polymerase sigma factor [Pirellulales bacterium]|nr:sigma-70 family RNA polymerase sigma factor [Pirellulales bacterium]